MDIMIFGAGKIARGFIGHLLWKSNLPFKFVEYNQNLVDLLNVRKCYSVRLLGEQIHTDYVTGFSAWSYRDREEILFSIASEISTIFISVGGKNLESVGRILRDGLELRYSSNNHVPLNIVLCENWVKPADIISAIVNEGASDAFKKFLGSSIGITESVIMRSAIEPTADVLKEDPIAVNVQDFWYLPIDKTRLRGCLPAIQSVEYIDNFKGYLDKKFYTYNAANGTVSYLGHLKGYTYISDAAQDPEILEILMMVYEETGRAICTKHGFDYEEHMAFTKTSLAKLQNKYIVDYVERNARDPIRKLGPSDRLVGPARLVVQYGGIPEGLATAIAAAIYYDEPSDQFSVELKRIREGKGPSYILDTICKLGEDEVNLKQLVLMKINILKDLGWIR